MLAEAGDVVRGMVHPGPILERGSALGWPLSPIVESHSNTTKHDKFSISSSGKDLAKFAGSSTLLAASPNDPEDERSVSQFDAVKEGLGTLAIF